MMKIKSILIFVSSLLIISCGGGGGGGSEGTSGSGSSPSYSITGSIYGSQLSTLDAYSDTNFSGKNDNGEWSSSVNSNGGFSLTTSNRTRYDCSRFMPYAAESSSDYFFSPNLDNSTNPVLNPFTTVFADYIYPIYYWDHPAIDGSECSVLNEVRDGILHGMSGAVLDRIEKYDGLTLNDLLINPSNPVSGNPIDNARTADLQKFYQSAKSIEDIIVTEWRAALLSSEYATADLSSRIEFDESVMRVFLNDSSYPNPSTDTSPVANSIDSISLPAGMDLIISIDLSSGWRDTLKVSLWDMHISNNGDLIADTSSCWINFSNLCKIDPTITNILDNFEPEIRSFFYKETSRGHETIGHTEQILDSETNQCEYWDRSSISELKTSSVIGRHYTEYYGNGYYYASDLQCGAWNNFADTLMMVEDNTNGERMALQIWHNNGGYWSDSSTFRQIKEDHVTYDEIDDGQIVSQVPSSIALALDDLDFDWQVMESTIDEKYIDRDIEVYLWYVDKNDNYVQLVLLPYSGSIFCMSNSNLAIPGGFISAGAEYSKEEIIDLCTTEIEFGNVISADSSAIKNISPYRGLIDD